MTNLHQPGARLVLGSATLALTAIAARRGRVSRPEERAFRAVNNLPDGLYGPLWLTMQFGTAGTVPVAAAIAWAWGDRALGARLALSGSATWVLAKAAKRAVGRPRPACLLAATNLRGREPSRLGYLSGHSGVAVALGAAAWPAFSRGARTGVALAVALVGLGRAYVGAHLPLDIIGGAALGLGAEALVLVAQRWAHAQAGSAEPVAR